MQFVQLSLTMLNSDFMSSYRKRNVKSATLLSRQKCHQQLCWMVDQAQPRGDPCHQCYSVAPVDTEEQGHI